MSADISATAALPATKQRDNQRIKELLVRSSMVMLMVVVIIGFTVANARFATLGNMQSILIAAAPFALIAIGQTIVILTGGIDLSVGSVIAASAMASAWFAKSNPDLLALVPVVAILVGLLVGSINGFLVAVLHVTPFVATLATLTAASGIAYAIGKGAPITGLKSAYGVFANTQFLGLAIPVWIMIIGLLITAFVLRRTSYGTTVYAVGGNEDASRIAGIRVKNVKFSVYMISGVLAGASGLLLSSRVVSGTPTLGQGYELQAIAAVVIGGASLMGGRGSIWGTLVGLFLIQTLNNGLDILLVPSYWQGVIMGALIAIAVAIDVYATRNLSK